MSRLKARRSSVPSGSSFFDQFGAELVELFALVFGDDEVLGGEAVLERVHGAARFALRGPRSCL